MAANTAPYDRKYKSANEPTKQPPTLHPSAFPTTPIPHFIGMRSNYFLRNCSSRLEGGITPL